MVWHEGLILGYSLYQKKRKEKDELEVDWDDNMCKLIHNITLFRPIAVFCGKTTAVLFYHVFY
jgi:hypothetical protein